MVGCCIVERFGIACERSHQPSLVGVPLALTGPDNKVVVASQEAAAAGVIPEQPLSAARLLCPSLSHRPYTTAAYLVAAEVIWNAVAVETSFVEPVSPECCLFELSGRDQEGRTATLIRSLRATLGIEVKGALAASRFVVEYAAKKAIDGTVTVVHPGDELTVTGSVAFDEVPGLDTAVRDRFAKLGIATLSELITLGARRMPKVLKEISTTLVRRAQGLDSPAIQPLWPPRSETARLSFEDEVGDLQRIDDALRHLTAQIANTLSGGFQFCRRLSLSVGFSDGSWQVEAEETASPIADKADLYRTAHRLLKRLAPTQAIAELVIEAGQIAAPRSIQLSLLDSNPGSGFLPHERSQRLTAAQRFLTRRFGGSTLLPLEHLAEARKIGLWTYPLGHITDEQVAVVTGSDGAPQTVCRRGRPVHIASVQNDWRETSWTCGQAVEHDAYRVVTAAGELWELHQFGSVWRLMSMAD